MFKVKMNLILTFVIFLKIFQNLKIYPRSEPYLPVGKTNRTFVQGCLEVPFDYFSTLFKLAWEIGTVGNHK